MRGSRHRRDVVYIKFGDVLVDLARIDAAEDYELQSGADAFLSDFLRWAEGTSVLLVSKGRSNTELHYREKVLARTLWAGSTPLTKLIAKAGLIIRVFYCLARVKPKWLLCGASQEMLWTAFAFAKLSRIPIVYSLHNRISTGSSSLPRRLSTVLDKACIRRSSGVVCHGPYLTQELRNIGVPASKVQEFDVDLSAFKSLVPASIGDAAGPGDRAKVLYVGRIERLKGVFDLLEALAPRLRRDETVQLLFAGKGSESDALAVEIERQGLSRQATLLGQMPHHELAALMHRCRVVVTPTKARFAEGRCMAAMESLALGVPVIAPDFGPFPFLVEHRKNGLLFEVDSVADLSEKLDAVFDDESLYKDLRLGARNSGMKLQQPPQSFSGAVSRSLGMASPETGNLWQRDA